MLDFDVQQLVPDIVFYFFLVCDADIAIEYDVTGKRIFGGAQRPDMNVMQIANSRNRLYHFLHFTKIYSFRNPVHG